jgi:hypothetical protein
MDNRNNSPVILKSILIVMILIMMILRLALLFIEVQVVVNKDLTVNRSEIIHLLISYLLPEIIALIGIIGICAENLFLTHLFLMKMAIVWFINHHKFKPQIWIRCEPIYVTSYIIDFIVILLIATYSYKLNQKHLTKYYL